MRAVHGAWVVAEAEARGGGIVRGATVRRSMPPPLELAPLDEPLPLPAAEPLPLPVHDIARWS